ncbi:HNH endonuclease [Nocardia sp. NBC_00511]|uniref:HNH endonuclease n=1 Tax=Nocardia sp. NBC_00511 TaxID=2903591 RepID=UPI0030E3F046
MAWGKGASERVGTARHKKQRARILERDGYHCQLRYPNRCIGRATEMDHRINVAAGGSDDDTNMQAACHPCHAKKTSNEAQVALAAKRAKLRLPAERHPGLQ